MVALACAEPGNETCSVVRVASAIVGGGGHTGYLGLTERQRQALVTLEIDPNDEFGLKDLCTAVVVGSDTLLTAAHCLERDDLTIGLRSGATSRVLTPAQRQIARHESADLITIQVPQLEAPYWLPLAQHDLSLLTSELVELGGSGITEDETAGELRFMVSRVRAVEQTAMIVESTLVGGPCGGDSGGPLLVRGPSGGIEVAGILSEGAPSCRGPDRYERLDVVADWLSQWASPPAMGESVCSTLGYVGRCFGRVAAYCEDGSDRSMQCGEGLDCGWSNQLGGYRCIEAGSDPCGGVTDLGSCSNKVARRCIDGIIEQVSCSECGANCAISPKSGKAICSTSRY